MEALIIKLYLNSVRFCLSAILNTVDNDTCIPLFEVVRELGLLTNDESLLNQQHAHLVLLNVMRQQHRHANHDCTHELVGYELCARLILDDWLVF